MKQGKNSSRGMSKAPIGGGAEDWQGWTYLLRSAPFHYFMADLDLSSFYAILVPLLSTYTDPFY